MKRFALVILVLLILTATGLYFFNQYWIHRYDALIARQAAIYRLDPALVWSIIYEETYFRPWQTGEAGEIGLMQVTPTVGREWAAETGMREFERAMARDPESVLRDPERNIQIGCWYLEKISKDYRELPGAEARMVAAYNAGPSRAADWNRTAPNQPPLTVEQFIARIDIPSTRAYVSSILERYHKVKAANANANTRASSRSESRP
jgi:soluble lytic murein transglycosylase